MRFIKQMSTNWKTTLAGIGVAIYPLWHTIGLLIDGNPSTNPDWPTAIPAIIAGLGLLFSRDSDKTSEQNHL